MLKPIGLRNSIQGIGDRFYWNQVHGRKVYVHRMSEAGREMIGIWKVFPKWWKS